MSVTNFLNTEKRAIESYLKTLTNVAAYTIKVGGVSDNFVFDRVISIVTIADGNDLVLTVPNGVYSGQKLLLIFTTQGDNETVTVTVTNGATVTFDAAGEFVELLWINSSVGWQKLRYESSV